MMKAQMKKVKQTEEYLEGLLKADAGVFKTMVLDVVSLTPFSGRGGRGRLKGWRARMEGGEVRKGGEIRVVVGGIRNARVLVMPPKDKTLGSVYLIQCMKTSMLMS